MHPNIIQVELTNRCNLSCSMCIRHFWNARLGDMNYDLFKKIARKYFKTSNRIDLYGEGEPLVYPRFLDALKGTRENLNKDGEILFSTNGTYLNESLANKVLKIGVDYIIFSIDTLNEEKLKSIRLGINPSLVIKNLKYLARNKHKGKRELKVGISTVITKKNLYDLIDLVEKANEYGIDFINVSHIFPYSKFIEKDALYTTIAKESIDSSTHLLKHGWNFVLNSIYESLFVVYGVRAGTKSAIELEKMWRNALRKNSGLNPPLLFEHKERIERLKEVREVFSKVKKISRELGIDVDLPEIIAKENERKCPYAEKKATIIRYDGSVAPCFNYLYTHPTFINNHIRWDKEVVFGNLKNEDLNDIWNSPNYVSLRERLKDMPRKTPWCGSCPFSSTGCWYANTNEYDCYGNSPSCNECLYSVNLVKCII